MARLQLNRRVFLLRAGVIGCSAAASPLLTPVTFAAAPWDNRLVVIILRGAMDGLDVVQPYGDADFAALRPGPRAGDAGGPLDLDGYFALHPALAPLMPLWQAGELGFVHAVSTPYRDKRSHFDGQDLLEAGTMPGAGIGRDGWLNRMLQGLPGVEAETAYAIGRDDLLLTRGAAPVANWSPEAALQLSPQARRLVDLVMHDDPLLRDATAEALELSDMDMLAGMDDPEFDEEEMTSREMRRDINEAAKSARDNSGHVKVADYAAQKLTGDSRIAAFSLGGWDTHANQHATLTPSLVKLAETIAALKAGLGPVWGKTTVVAMTEFGRTARLNGTRGTDHGTAGAMVLAGGALRGGQVVADWPGLAEAALYDRRDLMPTRDVRAHAAWVMRGLFGLSAAKLETDVFPGVEMGPDPRLIL